jgi:hypothetical protein
MLALGAGLLVFLPVGGALFLAAGVLGLALASETPAPTAIQPQPPSPTAQKASIGRFHDGCRAVTRAGEDAPRPERRDA